MEEFASALTQEKDSLPRTDEVGQDAVEMASYMQICCKWKIIFLLRDFFLYIILVFDGFLFDCLYYLNLHVLLEA